MTLGRLAAVDVTGGTNTLIYTIPEKSGQFTGTVNICNRNKFDVLIRLAFVDGDLADLVDADWVEYDVIVRAGGLIERSGFQMLPAQSLIGYSDKGNVSFQLWA